MPQLTSEQQDALQEAISKQLYRINNLVKGMFGQELSDEEIQRAHGRIMGGVQQGMRQLEQRKDAASQGLPLGRSRIEGDVRMGGTISNLPASPDDQKFMNPVAQGATQSLIQGPI